MDLWAGRDMRAAGYDELLPGEQAALEQRLRGEIRRNTWDAETATITIDASDWGETVQLSGAAFEYGPDPPTRSIDRSRT